MSGFGIDQVTFPAACVFLFSFLFSWVATSSYVASVSVSLLKSIAFFVYFVFIFDGSYTFLDDLNYLSGGEFLLSIDVGLSNIFENWGVMLMVGGGDHFVYYLHNAYAFRFFGVGYFAPVALNLILAACVAWVGSVVFGRHFSADDGVRKSFFVFLILYPELWTWSGVMNGKDTLVLLQHVLLLNSVSLYFVGRKWLALGLALLPIFVLFFLRFYVPVFFAGILFLYFQIQNRNLRSLLISPVVVLIIFIAADAAVGHLLGSAMESFADKRSNPLLGFVRMVLAPVPFGVDEGYGFLNAAAIFQWIMLPFSVVGMLIVARDKKFGMFLVVYFFVFVGFYSVYSELQGPRHRVQLDFAWAVVQFIGLREILRRYFGSSASYVQFRHST